MPLFPLTAAQGNMFPRHLKRDSELPFLLSCLRLRPPTWNGGIFRPVRSRRHLFPARSINPYQKRK